MKRNLYSIDAGVIKKGLSSSDGHTRSLDKIVWDILKCCGIDCCAGGFESGSEESIETFLQDNYVSELFVMEATIAPRVITLSNHMRSGFNAWIQVSINGVIQYPSVVLSAGTYQELSPISLILFSVTIGDIVEVKYIKDAS